MSSRLEGKNSRPVSRSKTLAFFNAVMIAIESTSDRRPHTHQQAISTSILALLEGTSIETQKVLFKLP